MALLLMFQLHEHIAAAILQQDARQANYYGENKIGDFLKSILNFGATEDWRTVLQRTTAKPLTADALLAYFEPLTIWLRKQNAGRQHTLPEYPEPSIDKEPLL